MGEELKFAPLCTGCGVCCRHISNYKEGLKGLPDPERFYFPHSWDDTGKCEMLTDDNKCKVYDNRPLICRVDDMAAALDCDPEVYVPMSVRNCNEMMDKYNIPEKFKIKT